MIKVKYRDHNGKIRGVDLATYDDYMGVFEETHLPVGSYITVEAIYAFSMYPQNIELKKALQNYFPELLL